MKKILISLLVLSTVLVSVSCGGGGDKPAPKYEIDITEKLTSVGSEYNSYNKGYVSITHYRFRYHYKTVDGTTDKGMYAEGDEIKDVSYTAYKKHNVGDKFIADSYVWFSFPN